MYISVVGNFRFQKLWNTEIKSYCSLTMACDYFKDLFLYFYLEREHTRVHEGGKKQRER